MPMDPSCFQILVLINLSIHLLFDLSIDPLIHLSSKISDLLLCLHFEMRQNGERIQNTVSPQTIPNSLDTTRVLFSANSRGQYVLSSMDKKTSLVALLHQGIL